jgi:hypothetical protein
MYDSRRHFLQLLFAAAVSRAYGQGVSSHSVKAQARAVPSGKPFRARFTDVAREAGLTAPVVYGGVDRKEYIIETVGCGCAMFDYDNDGWMDLLVLGGTRLGATPEGAGNRLYRNNRDGTFRDVTKQAGLDVVGWASAVTVGDYNNDGFEDLFITQWGQNRLFRNNGDGTFTDVTKQAGLWHEEVRWGAGCTWIDYNRDGHLDLFVSNYLGFDLTTAPKPGRTTNCNWKGLPVNCGPRGFPYGRHLLYRNNGDGTFSNVSREAGIDRSYETYGMTSVAADFDDDGWPDLYVACDSTPSLLFINNHDGTFREEGVLRGVALSEDGMEQAGMGVAVGDYDLDGRLDLLKTHFADDTHVLYRNMGRGEFEDRTLTARIGVENRYVGWGTGFADLDNDGYPDLLMVTGHVYPEVERALPNYPYKTPRLVFRNLGGGQFEELIEEAGPGIAAAHSSRGCAFGDFDNDGDVDALIINLNEPPSLLRNDVTGGGHWIKVRLIGTRSNRSAIGARVTARYGVHVQAQEVLAQSSFYSANDPRLHFGLGESNTVRLEIRWPSGLLQSIATVPADHFVIIKEGVGIVDSKR